MKFQSFIRYAIMVLASALAAACGGGAQTDPNAGGTLSVAPTEGTFFAGIPSTITISGGRAPYSVTSSDPSTLPVPGIVNTHSFEVVPNNPGVVDAGLAPDALPIRTVTVTVRDNDAGGDPKDIKIHVAFNFLTGYKVVFTTNCPSGNACAGGQTAVQLLDTFNGVTSGNRKFRFTVLRGPFSWVFPGGVTGSSIDLMTDHTGTVTAIFQVQAGVPAQLATFRVQDVATGVYADHVFAISGSVTTALTVLPNAMDFKAALKGVCGTGSNDVLVFDGMPPYTALASDPNLAVGLPGGTLSGQGPVMSTTQPGRFTIGAGNPNICLNPGTVVITDANNVRATVTVKTEEGSGTPPGPGLNVSPSGITLGCGQAGSVTVVGGTSTTYSASATSPRVSPGVSGNTLTITETDPAIGGTGTTSVTVNVTDGSTIFPVTVSIPATCP